MVRSKYSYISGGKFIKLLKHFGVVEIISQKGSHIKIRFNKKIITIVPNHKELAYGTFHSILKQLQIDEKKFIELIKK